MTYTAHIQPQDFSPMYPQAKGYIDSPLLVANLGKM